jgi:hypothetical protein
MLFEIVTHLFHIAFQLDKALADGLEIGSVGHLVFDFDHLGAEPGDFGRAAPELKEMGCERQHDRQSDGRESGVGDQKEPLLQIGRAFYFLHLRNHVLKVRCATVILAWRGAAVSRQRERLQ